MSFAPYPYISNLWQKKVTWIRYHKRAPVFPHNSTTSLTFFSAQQAITSSPALQAPSQFNLTRSTSGGWPKRKAHARRRSANSRIICNSPLDAIHQMNTCVCLLMIVMCKICGPTNWTAPNRKAQTIFKIYMKKTKTIGPKKMLSTKKKCY